MGRPIKYHQLNNRYWLERQEGRTLADIAREVGCHPVTVTQARIKFGLRPAPPTHHYYTKPTHG